MTLITPSRRSFITGLAALITAPAIVRAGSLMPVKVMEEVAAPPFFPNAYFSMWFRVDGEDWKFWEKIDGRNYVNGVRMDEIGFG